MYTLFFDSDCDVTPVECAEYGAKLISMPYMVDGEIIFPYVDFKEFDAPAFYGMLRKGTLPTTAALSEEEYRQYFEPELKEGKDILYIHFSRAMSVTFDVADKVIAELLAKYPGRRIQLIDTKAITLGGYSLAIQAGALYKEGKSIDEIVEWSKEAVNHNAFYFFADNLKFFAKSGRVTGFAAFMGGMIGIKPIIYIGDEGKMVSIDKAIGRKKALEKILGYMETLGDDIPSYPIIIAHCDAMGLVEELITEIKAKFGENLDIRVKNVNPTAGSHCGPDAVGVTFHAIHR